ncbi:MAG: efflux RND transporter permease subunit [Gammaproteobacteria bacterium]|nr:efflux RND transporter permease subunit [Gammaproteobacteria bacterium]
MSDTASGAAVSGESRVGGLIPFFARNRVAGNLLMVVLLGGGLYTIPRLPVENVPQVEARRISIVVPYPGSSPAEVEESITRRIEEKVLVVRGVDRVTTTAAESRGEVMVDVRPFADANRVLDDIRTAVERIERFPPPDAEQPEVALIEPPWNQMTVAVLSSSLSENELRLVAEQVQEDLLALPSVSMVTPFGTKDREISIEVDEEALREHQLTISAIDRRVRQASLNLSSGELRTEAGGLVIRTNTKRMRGEDFEDIVLLAHDDGTLVRLRDVAEVSDGFADIESFTRVDGRPGVLVQINRDGDQEPLEISREVRQLVAGYPAPPGVDVLVWDDRSRTLTARVGFLVTAGFLGFALVFVLLSLVFDFRVSLWVAVGVPTSFLGAMLFFPAADMTVNIVSIFALLLVIGIVVDDAVVVGESIATHQGQGQVGPAAAVSGARAVLGPVVLGVVTTMIAFVPLLFTYGAIGQMMNLLPVVVFLVLAVSLVEAFLILPSHLSHASPWSHWPLTRIQARSRAWLDEFRDRRMLPAISAAVRRPFVTVLVSIALVVAALLLFSTGVVRFVFFQSLEADRIQVDLTFPAGTPFDATVAAAEQVADAARLTNEQIDGDPIRTISVIGGRHIGQPSLLGVDSATAWATHRASVVLHLDDESQRSASPRQIERLWRRNIGDVPGTQKVRSNAGEGLATPGVAYVLAHHDEEVLVRAAGELRGTLEAIPALFEVEDSLVRGKRQFDIDLTDAGKAAGFSPASVAAQLRSRFYGSEVQRIQRGRDEIKVMVRYPEDRRRSLNELGDERILRPDGIEVPLHTVASIVETRNYASLMRVNGVRAIEVGARVDLGMSTPRMIERELDDVVASLQERYPGMQFYAIEGGQEREGLGEVLSYTIPLALLVMYVLIAVFFRSYAQPLIVLAGMPFAFAGGIFGHLILGYDVTAVSLFGMIAVAGVVVNDTLVLMHRYNRIRAEADIPAVAAVSAAARQRFRAIILTTATTVVGLLPILLVKAEVTANFVPMVVSIVFGLIVASLGILFFVPAVLLLEEQARERLAFKAP